MSNNVGDNYTTPSSTEFAARHAAISAVSHATRRPGIVLLKCSAAFYFDTVTSPSAMRPPCNLSLTVTDDRSSDHILSELPTLSRELRPQPKIQIADVSDLMRVCCHGGGTRNELSNALLVRT